MDNFLLAFLVGESFLLSFLLWFHPLKENIKANRWLSFFGFLFGAAFLANYLENASSFALKQILLKLLASLQFLLAPSVFISILFFVNPTEKFRIRYWLHFLPFGLFAAVEFLVFPADQSLARFTLFEIGETSVWLRDLLPLQFAIYLVICYRTLQRHTKNLELVTASTSKSDLKWLKRFLLIFILPVVFWINDAFGIAPVLVKFNRFVYAVSVLLLAYSAMRQTAIFPFKTDELAEIGELINDTAVENNATEISAASRQKRLDGTQIAELSEKLHKLMTEERLYLDNELTLATIADKLGIGIHDASFLINEVTGSNFYNYINKFRVEEAKKLLQSEDAKRFSVLGIAFESGFNSKTAFYAAFKKFAGVSPSEFLKDSD